MGKSRPTVGYRYYMGLHMGVSRGPVDELLEIRVGDRSAWRGRERVETYQIQGTGWAGMRMTGRRRVPDDSYAVTSSQTVTIDAQNLFGGTPSGEGGISGNLTVMMGESSQVAPAGLASMLGGLVPGFRGFLSLFFNGMVGAMNPYPKTWTPRVRRTTAGWDGSVWYPAKATIWLGTGQGHNGIRAMNPAHIIYELYTNRDFGRGLPPARLDLPSFQAAADRLYTEGFGLCLAWTRQTSVADFMQIVLDHIGAACAPDLSTGLIRLKLIRDDYDEAALPTFGYDSGLLGIDEEESSSTDAVANEIMVGWFDPVQKRKRQTPPVQNLGSIQAVGRKSTTRDYPGISTAGLAMRVAQRDLRASSRALKRFRVRLDRRGYAIQPGDAFRINVPARGINNLVVRAGRIEEGAITDGTITVTCVQDVFGLPAAATVSEQPSLPDPSYDVPPAIPASRLVEAPYAVLAQMLPSADLAALEDTSGYVGTLAAAPATYTTDYLIYSRAGAAAFTFKSDRGDWCATAVAVGAVGPGLTPVTVSLASPDRLESVVVGSPVMWEDEILRVDAIDPTALTATLARGCADTVPAAHAAGSRLWFMGADMALDSTEYLVGEVVSIKLLATTPENFADPATVPAATLTMAQRHHRPYPPGNVRLNGAAFPAEIDGAVSVSFAHRDRILEADQLVDAAASSVGPEAGTTYAYRLLRTDTGAAVESGGAASPFALTSTYRGDVRLEVWSVREGLESWQRVAVEFRWLAPSRITESGDLRITESGDTRILEA